MPQYLNASMIDNLTAYFLRRGERLSEEGIEFEDIKIVSPTGATISVVYEKFGHDLSGEISINNLGTLDITAAADLKLTPASNSIVPGASEVTLGTRVDKFLTAEAVELKAPSTVPSGNTSAIGGSLIVAAATTTLISEVREYHTYIQVLDAALGTTTGTDGDYVRLQYDGDVEWMKIGVHDDPETGMIYKLVTGGYEYLVTRDLDGSGVNFWRAGDGVVNTGQAGDGFIETHAGDGFEGDPGPSVRIYKRPAEVDTYDDYSVHALLGNLDGAYGYATTEFGVGIGNELLDHIVIDPTNGIRFRDSANNVHAQLTSAVWTIGKTTDANIKIEAGKLSLRDGTTETIVLEADGDVFVGSNLSAAATTFLSIFANNQTYNTEAMVAGDLLIGNNSTGKGNIKASAGDLIIRKGTVEAIALEADGDVFIGSNLSAPATTFLSIFANNQTYNTESMTAGDMLIGDNSAGKSNILYDYSAGRLIFRGEKTQNIYIDADGSLVAGSVTIDSGGITVNATDDIIFEVTGTPVGVIGGDAGSYSPFDGIKVVTDDASGSAFEVLAKHNGTEAAALTLTTIGTAEGWFRIHIEGDEIVSILHDSAAIDCATYITNTVSSSVALTVEAAASQSNSILELLDSSNNPLVTFGSGGSLYMPIATLETGTHSVTDAHFTILCDSTEGSVTLNLPSASTSVGRILNVKKIVAANTVTLDPNSTELIEGASTLAWTTDLRSYTIQCDGSAWYIISTKQ